MGNDSQKKFIEDFEKNHKGIFQPIKAFVFETTEDATGDLNKMLDVQRKNETNAVIGYFSASKDFNPEDPRSTIGFSVIDPSDYFIGSMDLQISKVRSASFCLSPDKKISGRMLVKDLCVINEDNTYVFPLSIKEQFDRFVARCNRYFCKSK